MTGLWLMAQLAEIPAWGGTTVVVADGPLRPGRAATLEVGTMGPAGTPELEPPALAVEGGRCLGLPRACVRGSGASGWCPISRCGSWR